MHKIGKFTALTCLEPSEFRPAGEDSAAMQNLPLQELVLLYCHNLEIHLLVAGALLSLRRLHIEDTDRRKQTIRKQPEMMEKLAVCSRFLLSLPDLYQLPGSGVLFCAATKIVLQTWHVGK